MSLRDLQLAIAALTCEAGQIERYEADPAAWCKAARLDDAEAARLRSVALRDLRRFRDIHARDRARVVRSLFPETLPALRESILEEYFAAVPYGHPDYVVEAERFAAFLGTPAARAEAEGWRRYRDAKVRS